MTDPTTVKFVSFHTDKMTYTKPVSNVTETINFVGKISKGGFGGFSVNITVTLPDKSTKPLSSLPTGSGEFKIGYPLDKNSQAGQYKAKAKYMEAESDEINFKIK